MKTNLWMTCAMIGLALAGCGPKTPKGAKLRGLVPADAKFPPAVKYQPGSPVEEQRPVFTRTAKDGQVSLVLGFDALRKIERP